MSDDTSETITPAPKLDPSAATLPAASAATLPAAMAARLEAAEAVIAQLAAFVRWAFPGHAGLPPAAS